MRIGLALGGGGAKGFAHLGLLHAFNKAGIHPDIISGTSMGAIIAVGFVQEKTLPSAVVKFRDFVLHYADRFHGMDYIETKKENKKGLIKNTLKTMQFLYKLAQFSKKVYVEDGTLIKNVVEHFIFPCNLDDLTTPVYVSALDIRSGRCVYFNKGSAREALKASMSIAGYFPGAELEQMLLFDPQDVFPVPVQAFQLVDVDLIISCSLTDNIAEDFKPTNVVDLLFRQNDLNYGHVISEVFSCSDIVIEPNLSDIHWTDFHKIDIIMKRGLQAAQKIIPIIKEYMEGKRIPKKKQRASLA